MHEHFGCRATRTGSQFHLKALQFQPKEKQRTSRNIFVNTNLVASGIEVCKIKSAGMSYEHLIAFLSFCEEDVGNVGLGRFFYLKSQESKQYRDIGRMVRSALQSTACSSKTVFQH